MAVPGGFNIWLNANKKPLGWNGTDSNEAWNKYGQRYQGIGANRQNAYDKTWAAQNPTATTPSVAPAVNEFETKFNNLQKQYDSLNANYNNLNTNYNSVKNQPTPIVADTTSLLPTPGSFEPADYTGSEMYKFQAQTGADKLNAQLAKQGLTGSTAAARGHADLLAQLGASESERVAERAQSDANRLWDIQKFEAERQDSLKENEATRGERTGSNKWGQLMDILNYGYQVSPIANGYSAANSLSTLAQAQGSTLGDYLSQMYAQSSGGGGGGGGGSSVAAPIYPYTSVGNNLAQQANNQYDNAITNIYGNAASSILPSLISSIFGG